MTDYTAVIPAYNAQDTIEDAINSILAQTVAAKEIIIVDDGSTDETVNIIRAMNGPIRLVTQENRGCGHATTVGIKLVSTPLMAPLDADDLWFPDKMQRQLAELSAHNEIAAVFARLRTFKKHDEPHDPRKINDGWSRTTMTIRTRIALANGDIIDPVGGAGDMVDWLARLRESGHQLKMMPDVLALRRIRPGSMTYQKTEKRDSGYLNVARAAILRKRAEKK